VLAFLSNLGMSEMVIIALVAVLIFGKNLPQAASKAYLQVRKFRGAVDDLRRESGIDRELREIERTVREAEWEARRSAALPPSNEPQVPRTPRAVPAPAPEPPAEETSPPPAEPPPTRSGS